MNSDLLKIVSTINWDVQRFNAYPFFLSSAATLSGFDLSWGTSYSHFLCISHNKNIEWHYDVSDYQRIGKIFWEKIKAADELNALINEYRNSYKEASKLAVYKEEDLEKFSIEEIKSLLKKQINLLKMSGGIAHVIECASFVGEAKLKALYPVDTPHINASEDSFLKRAESFARELVLKEKDEKTILDKFNNEFAWVQGSYLGRNPLSISDVKSLASKSKVHEELESLSSDDPFMLILSHLFSWQDERKANLLKSIYLAEPVLLALARKLSIPFENIKFLLPEEVDKTSDLNFQKILSDRAKLFVDYVKNDLSRILFVGEEADSFIKNFQEGKSSEVSEFKGSIAFKGKVKGTVRICLSLESIKSFEDGEILVASMTRPEYISAMQHASAFITDEGGITCHAAIIAREMKKPCIIGTKIATKVLKDGDLVEVNADTGVVKILKRE